MRRRTWSAWAGVAAAIAATSISDDWQKLVSNPEIDIVIEATGNPVAAVEHILGAFRHGKHVDQRDRRGRCVLRPDAGAAGRKAAGVVYSLAYGDQPAIICDLVDWARAAGFPVVAAGRGHKWLPHFAQSTPETVWGYYGLTPEQAKLGGLNPKMFNSFLDGSKPAIEIQRGVQRHRPDAGARRAALSAGFGGRDSGADAAQGRRRRAASQGAGRSRFLAAKRWQRRFPTTSASASGWCSRARPSTSGAASPNTA